MTLSYEYIKTRIDTSQHCQRNWDLSKSVPEEDLDLIIHAATQCPSKQNCRYYKVTVIKNRDLIEQIHNHTVGFTHKDTTEIFTNSQTLANILFVFQLDISPEVMHKNMQYEDNNFEIVKRDSDVAVGIASGYVNLIASLLGYNTGYCQCFDSRAIQAILDDDASVLLMVGVGYKNKNISRFVHHADHSKEYYPIVKQQIEIRTFE